MPEGKPIQIKAGIIRTPPGGMLPGKNGMEQLSDVNILRSIFQL